MQVRQHLVLSTYEAHPLEHFREDALDLIKFPFHILDLVCEVLVQLRVLPTNYLSLALMSTLLTLSLARAPFESSPAAL